MFAIRAIHAFDGEDFLAGGATVLVEDGRIVGVEAGAYELPSDCELIDYGDATVLPGLIDTHVHLVGDSGVMALERVAGYFAGRNRCCGRGGAATPPRRWCDDGS